jgi:hypothetical protein
VFMDKREWLAPIALTPTVGSASLHAPDSLSAPAPMTRRSGAPLPTRVPSQSRMKHFDRSIKGKLITRERS